jgi:pimeloyl-ACP methyl ester carboxylesterase
MSDLSPEVQIIGHGPYVLCLHSSTSSSKQWRDLVETLSGEFTVVTPDLYGYGKSPQWDEHRPMELQDEIDLLRPVLKSIPGPYHLIAHSYGGAVAFRLASTEPARVRSLVVYEPVLFNLLFEERDLDSALEIWLLSDDVNWLLVDGRNARAAERFVDYWSGEGTWAALPGWQKKAIEGRMTKVVSDFDATMGDSTRLNVYARLRIPTLFMYGAQSPQPTRRIAEWLGTHLPNVEVRGLLPLGHMGPVTHARYVNDLIARFLRGQPTGILPHQIRRAV